MKPTKLKSGNYRVQKMVDGKSYSMTFDHKPTQAEIQSELSNRMHTSVTSKSAPNLTFRECAEQFMLINDNVLRTGTKRNYRSIQRVIPDYMNEVKLCNIDAILLQKYVNDLSGKLQPKTVKNYYSFVHDVIITFIPDFSCKVKLPSPKKTEYYIPTSEEVRKVLAQASDKYRPLFMLGCYGLRKEEILALTLDDFDLESETVKVTKVYVYDDAHQKWIIENYTKTVESYRTVPLDRSLIQTFLDRGYVYNGTQSRVLTHLHYCQDKAEVPRFRMHDFRHYFATELDQAGFSSKDIQKMGGWSSDHIMKRVYEHNRIEKDKTMQKKAVNVIKNGIV